MRHESWALFPHPPSSLVTNASLRPDTRFFSSKYSIAMLAVSACDRIGYTFANVTFCLVEQMGVSHVNDKRSSCPHCLFCIFHLYDVANANLQN